MNTTTTSQPPANLLALALGAQALEALAAGLRAVLVPLIALVLTACGCGHEACRRGQQARAERIERLQGLPVRELRQLAREAGHRAIARNGRKADLLTVLAG